MRLNIKENSIRVICEKDEKSFSAKNKYGAMWLYFNVLYLQPPKYRVEDFISDYPEYKRVVEREDIHDWFFQDPRLWRIDYIYINGERTADFDFYEKAFDLFGLPWEGVLDMEEIEDTLGTGDEIEDEE